MAIDIDKASAEELRAHIRERERGLSRRGYSPPLPALVDLPAYELRGQYKMDDAKLSPREILVLREIAAGLTNREIAERLGISVKTIDTHRGHALKKTGARNNADLTRWAICNNLVDLDGSIKYSEERANADDREGATDRRRV